MCIGVVSRRIEGQVKEMVYRYACLPVGGKGREAGMEEGKTMEEEYRPRCEGVE